MGSDGAGSAASHSDGFGIGGFRPAARNTVPLAPGSPLLDPSEGVLTEPAISASSSSLAGRWCLPPQTSSRKFGGEASTGGRLLTLPSDGLSQLRPLLEAKPRSSSCAARTARMVPEEAPSTTAISRRPSRVADATRLYPEAQMKPVLNPSAPG